MVASERRPAWLFLNLALTVVGALVVNYLFRDEIPLSPVAIGLALLLYVALYFGFRLRGRGLYRFAPPALSVHAAGEAPRGARAGMVRAFLFNSHFLLLLSFASLVNYYDGRTRGVIEVYPVISGNIAIFFKHNKTVLGGGQLPFVDRQVYRLALHTIEITKNSIWNIASKRAEQTAGAKAANYLQGLVKAVTSFSLPKILEELDKRIRYKGKSPISIMNIQVWTYTSPDLSAGELETLDSTVVRKPVFVRGPLVLRKGFTEKDITAIPPYPPGFGGIKPDSMHFLRRFYTEKWFTAFYSPNTELHKIRRGQLAQPTTPPILLWIQNDCDEPVDTDGTVFMDEAGIQRDYLLASNEALRQALLERFFGRKIWVQINGYQQYEAVRGSTAARNLNIRKHFRENEILELPPVRWMSGQLAADMEQAVRELHARLAPMVEDTITRGGGVEISTVERRINSFSDAYILAALVLPFFLWACLMLVRYLFYFRVEGRLP